MKKRMIFCLSIVLALMMAVPALADTTATDIVFTYNDEVATFETSPLEIDGKLYLPMREAFSLGGVYVEYYSPEETFDAEISFPKGSIYLEGYTIDLATKELSYMWGAYDDLPMDITIDMVLVGEMYFIHMDSYILLVQAVYEDAYEYYEPEDYVVGVSWDAETKQLVITNVDTYYDNWEKEYIAAEAARIEHIKWRLTRQTPTPLSVNKSKVFHKDVESLVADPMFQYTYQKIESLATSFMNSYLEYDYYNEKPLILPDIKLTATENTLTTEIYLDNRILGEFADVTIEEIKAEIAAMREEYGEEEFFEGMSYIYEYLFYYTDFWADIVFDTVATDTVNIALEVYVHGEKVFTFTDDYIRE